MPPTPFLSRTRRAALVAGALALPSSRIALATVHVIARRECDGDAMSVSYDAAPVWEEVRKALETSILSRGTSFIVTSGVSVSRTLSEDGKLLLEDTTA